MAYGPVHRVRLVQIQQRSAYGPARGDDPATPEAGEPRGSPPSTDHSPASTLARLSSIFLTAPTVGT